MAKRKRASSTRKPSSSRSSSSRSSASRGTFINQAVKAGRDALRDVQKRVPPDFRKTIQATGRSFEKTVSSSMKQIQTQLNRTASQADLAKLQKKIDDLTRSEEHTSELQSQSNLVCRLLLEKKKRQKILKKYELRR